MEIRDEEFIKPACSSGKGYKAEKLITASKSLAERFERSAM